MVSVRPFQIDVPQPILDDLRYRLQHTRGPGSVPGTGWRRGVNLDCMRELVAYWLNAYGGRPAHILPATANICPHSRLMITIP